MKVLYIASGSGLAGGATKSLITLLNQAKINGIHIEVVCPEEKGLAQWLRDNGIKVHVVPFRHVRIPFSKTLTDKIKWLPRLIHDFWINYRARAAVNRIASEFAPDIIHENSSVINVGYYASKHIHVPDVVHIREYGDLDFKMKLPGRKSRLKAYNIYTLSITKDIARHLNQDVNPKATQIYDGMVDLSEFRFNRDKKRYFLYAGRIENAKGIADLLDVYADYAHAITNPFPLHICGGCNHPDFLTKMKAFVKEKGIESNVVWMGERSDIADIMAEAGATIIPSRFEGLGRVMPEAMTNGSLCVAKNTGGTKEQLDNGLEYTGAPIAIAYEEGDQLKEILFNITKEFDKGNAFIPGSDFSNMIERSQEAVKEFFSEQRFGEKLLDFYNKILSKE